jgi:RNA-directed DNA polymerase
VDGQTFADVEAYGVKKWLGELAQTVRKETYDPQPIRRVNIPKPDGKLRPLGISCLTDRVCMMAAVLILEPIFETDLPTEQYGYRSGVSAHVAVKPVVGKPPHASLHPGVAAMGGEPATEGQIGHLCRRPGDPVQTGIGKQCVAMSAR